MAVRFQFVTRCLCGHGDCSARGCRREGIFEVQALVQGGERQGTYKRKLFFCPDCLVVFACRHLEGSNKKSALLAYASYVVNE